MRYIGVVLTGLAQNIAQWDYLMVRSILANWKAKAGRFLAASPSGRSVHSVPGRRMRHFIEQLVRSRENPRDAASHGLWRSLAASCGFSRLSPMFNEMRPGPLCGAIPFIEVGAVSASESTIGGSSLDPPTHDSCLLAWMKKTRKCLWF